ncbi:hypothetical protein BaRGS_00040488, partial [Batillaria attramentaria]
VWLRPRLVKSKQWRDTAVRERTRPMATHPQSSLECGVHEAELKQDWTSRLPLPTSTTNTVYSRYGLLPLRSTPAYYVPASAATPALPLLKQHYSNYSRCSEHRTAGRSAGQAGRSRRQFGNSGHLSTAELKSLRGRTKGAYDIQLRNLIGHNAAANNIFPISTRLSPRRSERGRESERGGDR